MSASFSYLAVSVVGAAFTLVALRPPRRPMALLGVTFFAAWLTTELAAIHLAWQLVATAIFAGLGAFGNWPGWLGLVVTLASWAGLVVSVRAAHRTDVAFAGALDAALGDGWRERISPEWTTPATRFDWHRVALPLRFGHDGVERISNLQYVDDGARRHRLDVYRSADVGPAAPVLLQIHGGGWMIGNKDQQGLPLLYHLAARGWVCVAINYRLSPRAIWPDQLVDCKRALAWIRANVARYGGDPDYVVVTGGSAGGHLTAMMALTANDPIFQPGFEAVDTRVRAMVPFYGVYDWTDRFELRGRRDPLRRALERYIVKQPRDHAFDVYAHASPMNHARADAPPALIVHGALDTLVPVEEAREFVSILRDHSTSPVAYVELDGAHHAFEVFNSIRTLHTIASVEGFLGWVVSVDRSGEPSRLDGGRSDTGAPDDVATDPRSTAHTAP